MVLPLTPVRFKRHAARIFGRKQGIVCGDLRFTYGEFNERCDRLSQALLKIGVGERERVASLSFNCHRLLEACYGVPQIGAILLPLNIRLSPEELAHILNESNPRVLFFDPESIPLIEALRPKVHTVEHFIALRRCRRGGPGWAHPKVYDELVAEAEPREIDYRKIDEHLVAELFYTSGTTAQIKGVMLTHRNLYLHAFYTATALRAGDDEVSLYTIPIFHVNSWGTPHITTLVGGTHVILRKFDPKEVLELAQRERVTRLQMVPAMVMALINHPDFARYDLSSVREVILGGAPSSPELIRQVEEKMPGAVARGGYGLTETSPVISQARIKAHLANDPGEVKLRRKASAGYALAGAEIRVVDPAGQDVKPDARQVGEIIVRGDVVMSGYFNQPEETSRATCDDWFHTGDLATLDEEGYILIVDRVKDMIVSGGENIGSAEIERVLYLHPAVLECAAIAVPDDAWGEAPKAIVTLKPGTTATERDILDHCRKYLGGFKVPHSVEFMDQLPKGGTGKILKKVLREKYWAGRERGVH